MKPYLIFLIPLIFGISEASAQVYVQNDQQYIGEDGALHIVGEIQNDLNVPLNQIEVFVTLYSENNEEIDIESTSSLLRTIMPGMKSPFDLVIFGDASKNIQSYSLDVDYKVTSPKNQVMEITSSELSRGVLDNLIIKGTVANRGEITANTVSIVATVFAAAVMIL